MTGGDTAVDRTAPRQRRRPDATRPRPYHRATLVPHERPTRCCGPVTARSCRLAGPSFLIVDVRRVQGGAVAPHGTRRPGLTPRACHSERVDRFRFLISDRDSKFTTAFDAVFTGVDIRIIRTPIKVSPENAIAESLHRRPATGMPRAPPDHQTTPSRRRAARVRAAFQRAPTPRSLEQRPPAGSTRWFRSRCEVRAGAAAVPPRPGKVGATTRARRWPERSRGSRSPGARARPRRRAGRRAPQC